MEDAPRRKRSKETARDQQRSWRARNPDKVKASLARQYAKDREKILEGQKRYRERNSEAVAAGRSRWLAANLEMVNARRRRYHKDKPEKAAAYQRRYNQANREKVSAYIERWHAANPGKMAYYGAKRRAATMQATPSWAEPELIELVYAEAAHRGMQVDHIIPLQGRNVCGLHIHYNMQLLTKRENGRKSNSFAPSMGCNNVLQKAA